MHRASYLTALALFAGLPFLPAEALATDPCWSTIGASRDMVRELDECSIEARGSIRIATLRDTLLIPSRDMADVGHSVALTYVNCLTGEMASKQLSLYREDGYLLSEMTYDELQYTEMAPDTQGAAAIATVCAAKPREKAI